MTSLVAALPYIQIAFAVLLVIAILLQRSSAGLGTIAGSDEGVFFHKKRGFEKFLFIFSIICAIIFVISAIFSIVSF